MSLYELGTIAYNHLGLMILLFNNSRLGMVREIQDRVFGKTSCVNLDANPDFIKLCEAYGIKGLRVTDNSGLEAAFDKAIKEKGPILVECVVDPCESTL